MMDTGIEHGNAARQILTLATQNAFALEAGRADDALALLGRALDLARKAGNDARESSSPARLTVHPDGHWFQLDDEPAVDCRRHAALSRLLAALAEHRSAAPGTALSKSDLVERGWPAQKLLRGSARNRLHVALNALRKRGLREVLIRDRDGYLLCPEVELAWGRRGLRALSP
jgi:hypothetical protein